MIENDGQLDQANEALARLERAVSALRARVFSQNPELFRAMVEDYQSNIAAIRQDIDRYLGLVEDGSRGAPLWMKLEGSGLSGRDVSSRLLADWLDRFRTSLYGVTAYLEKGILRTSGRPDAGIVAATDPYVIAVAPGSIRVGLRLPDVEPPQTDLFNRYAAEDSAPRRALDQILDVASWAASREIAPPLQGETDRARLTVVARFAAELAPKPRGDVQMVTFSGALLPSPEPVRLTPEARSRLEGLVEILGSVSEETIYGQIREIDLDKRRITLRERGPGEPDIKCFLPPEFMERARTLLNAPVVVRGHISSASPSTMNALALDPQTASEPDTPAESSRLAE